MSSKACTSGGSSLPPTAPEERNRSVAAPFNPYATPVLSGAPELAALKERLQPAGDHGRKKQSLSAVQHGLGYCTQALAFLFVCHVRRQRVPSMRLCSFFRVSTDPDALSLQHVRAPTHRLAERAIVGSVVFLHETNARRARGALQPTVVYIREAR